VTSAERPFTETERAFLEQIREWGKKIVVVINKVDILAGDAELEQVQRYVSDNARALLGTVPEILSVVSRTCGRRAASRRSSITSGRPSTRGAGFS
jgi:predicted GTPase